VPTVIDSYYLVTLGGYRALYILNWIVRGATEHTFDPISVIFGVIQTALYVDFAWVYYSRQRVKLRGGGVIDADDLSKSFLVRRIIGRGSRADQEDDDGGEEEAQTGSTNGQLIVPHKQSKRSFGNRGISISADDTLTEHEGAYADVTAAGDAQMIDPAHFEDVDDDADAPPPPAKDNKYTPSPEYTADDSTSTWAQNTGDGGSK
jgi:ER lumen protein retaining receptor